MQKIAVVKGDGIGPEVIDAALEVLDHVLPGLQQVHVEVGYGRWRRTGDAISAQDIDTLKDCGCILFGAITTPPDPSYKSVLLRIRKELDLYSNIRPLLGNGMDIVIVRENTEGLYSGIEDIGDKRATTLRVITLEGSRRIARAACKVALQRKRLTVVHKSNVLKSDTLFLNSCMQVAREEGVLADDMLVDAAAYTMVRSPGRFDVMVTTNLFGDILSDLGAGIAGSLGLCASANLGDRYALFEPIHGSAPDIAGKGIANPVGAIRSVSLMLQWMGEHKLAANVERAVKAALDEGFLTPDLGGTMSTRQVAKAVVSHL